MSSMRTGFAALMMAAACFVGCEKESSVKTEKTVTGYDGQTKVTTETKVEKSGSNPPPAGTP